MTTLPGSCLASLGILLVACAGIASSPAPQKPSAAFPFAIGNHWVYNVQRYDGFNPDAIMWTTQAITETVTAMDAFEGKTRVTLRIDKGQETKLAISTTDAHELEPASTGETSWLVEENRIWREQREYTNPKIVQGRELEFVFPLIVGSKWHQVEELTRIDPNLENESMLWQVIQESEINTPAGIFSDCFHLTNVIGGSTFERWFCSGVGIVQEKDDHHGTPFGSQKTLIEYQIAK